jgi:hypothetical protein
MAQKVLHPAEAVEQVFNRKWAISRRNALKYGRPGKKVFSR